MFQVPEPPPTLVTRQIECVSCKQLFTVTEDTPVTNHTRQGNWHLVPDYRAEITLRERPDWEHRSVMPPSRAQPEQNHTGFTQLANNHQKFHVNCPRCGADNRNWMQIIHCPPIEGASNFPMAKQFFVMSHRFPLALIGFTITLSITFVTFGQSLLARDSINQIVRYTLPQVLFVFLSGLVPTLLITQQWQRLRDYKNLYHYLGPRPLVERILLPQLNSLAYLGVFLIVIPLLLYFIIPWAFNVAFSLIITTPEVADSQKELFTVDKQFLKAWFWTVGLSGLIAVIFAAIAVEKFVGQVNAQVPPPIFYSVANMTRVVAWEAKRALGISGSVNFIQWTEARRNEIGGIDLVGIHREDPETSYSRASLNGRVLAQCYSVSSNIWGHIESSSVQDTKVPPMVGMSYYVVDSSLWPIRSSNSPVSASSQAPLQSMERGQPLQYYPDHLPQSRDGTAYRNNSSQILSPRNPRGGTTQQSPRVSPSSTIQYANSHPTFSNTGTLPLGEVAKLRDMIDRYFNQSELEDLCLDLNIAYDRVRGRNKRDKVRELILYIARRSLIPELITVCSRLRPSAFWGVNS